jgi:hypothetical protein
MASSHPILHMASFSRSGETVMLRALQAHQMLHVVHQVKDPETPENVNLFKTLMQHAPLQIGAEHPAVRAARVPSHATLVVKNALWTHKWPFRGFVLVRNPFSVVNSFKAVHESKKRMVKRRLQLKRWTKRIDPALLPALASVNTVAYVCMLYNRKMHGLAFGGLPIVRYEDFVESPERVLRALLSRLEIPWDRAVLDSHKNYKVGELGHGKIRLWEPIHCRSADSWKDMDAATRSTIYGISNPTMHAFGYAYDGEHLTRNNTNQYVI